MIVIDKFNRKYLLLISLLLNGLALWFFTMTKIIGLLYFDRFFSGVFQVYRIEINKFRHSVLYIVLFGLINTGQEPKRP
jgi:hypothetical protein